MQPIVPAEMLNSLILLCKYYKVQFNYYILFIGILSMLTFFYRFLHILIFILCHVSNITFFFSVLNSYPIIMLYPTLSCNRERDKNEESLVPKKGGLTILSNIIYN